jgi:hypothetical protein
MMSDIEVEHCMLEGTRPKGKTMDLNSCLADPARRRIFLLTKALEQNPLPEALRLAQAAEAFLTGKGDEMPRLSDAQVHQLSRSFH